MHEANAVRFVLRHRRLSPDRLAIETEERSFTYSELGWLVDSMATRLRGSGLEPGELVAIAADSEVLLLVATLAVTAAGGSFTVIRKSMLNSTGREPSPGIVVRRLITDHSGLALAGLHTELISPESLCPEPVAQVAMSTPLDAPENPNGAHFCLITGSGSTGKPKRFLVSHREEISHLTTRITALDLSSHDRIASLSHIQFTTARRHVMSGLAVGATVMLRLKSPSATEPMSDLLRSQVTVLHSSVLGLHTLLAAGKSHPTHLPSLRMLVAGGSEVSQALRHRVDQHFHDRLHVVYGTNELGFLAVASPSDWRETPGTIGSAIAGIEAQAVDEHDRPLPAGKAGLLRFRKPDMMSGYLEDPAMTARNFRDGWFYPHDAGSIDQRRQIRWLGRADDMMIFNGINIYPSEIESTLRRLEDILDIVAVPMRHPIHQDVPVCAVVLTAGSNLGSEAIMRHGQRMLGASSPKLVFLVDHIPRDPQGKLLRPQLRAMLEPMIKSQRSR
jgi:acyl-coenzyme A synthetase/AMP-(fatty) acid ligase